MQRPTRCDDQERDIRAALAKQGISCGSNVLVLRDEAKSATTNNGRDAFGELMELVRAGRVALLVVDDQARFSRADFAYMLICDIVFHGGRFISTGEGIDTDQEGWQLRVKVMELHNSTTIRELGRRVRTGQKGRVLDGNGSAGDTRFGYRSEYVDPNWVQALATRGPKPKKVIHICKHEAAIVREIFARFNAGWSICAIARWLNDEQIPKGRRCRKQQWCNMDVRKILGNSKYIGLWTWGTTTTVRDSQGRKRQLPVVPGNSVQVERPDLRIIDDSNWQQAQALLQKLGNIYGQKPHQMRRGMRVHYTKLYPSSLLGGLIFCGLCGARMIVQKGGGNYKYLGCPNHRDGTCIMVCRVPVDRGEKAIIDFIAGILSKRSAWMETAVATMRKVIKDMATAVPDALAADEIALQKAEKRIANVTDALADGLERSPALRDKMQTLETEAANLRQRIDQQRRLLDRPVELPDDAWIQDQLANLLSVVNEDERTAAVMLRKLIGKATAYEVKPRGKKRGYAQLRFRVDALQTLSAALRGRIDVDVEMFAGMGTTSLRSPEFTIDLGSPSRMDQLAPQVVELRKKGVPWNEIGRITGLGSGNAWTAWKRWTAADDEDTAAA